jgi:hypothetical protein
MEARRNKAFIEVFVTAKPLASAHPLGLRVFFINTWMFWIVQVRYRALLPWFAMIVAKYISSLAEPIRLPLQQIRFLTLPLQRNDIV